MKSRLTHPISLWLAAIMIALSLDYVVAQWLHESGLPATLRQPEPHVLKWLRLPGEYWFAAILAGLAATFYVRDRGRALAFILLCGVVTTSNTLIKWIVGRSRPFRVIGGHQTDELTPYAFQPFYGGLQHLQLPANLSFPSGHAGLAFATAAGMAILFPRLRWLFYGIAALTGVERVLENAHYLSDVVVAAALGVGAAHLLHWLLFVRLAETERTKAEQQFPLTAAHP